jgi:hypothetical protein
VIDENRKVFTKALDIIRKELTPEEFTRFLSFISARKGDSVKELRQLRDTLSKEELDKALKELGAEFT